MIGILPREKEKKLGKSALDLTYSVALCCDFRGISPNWVFTPLKKTSCHIFKMDVFSKFFGDSISHIIK